VVGGNGRSQGSPPRSRWHWSPCPEAARESWRSTIGSPAPGEERHRSPGPATHRGRSHDSPDSRAGTIRASIGVAEQPNGERPRAEAVWNNLGLRRVIGRSNDDAECLGCTPRPLPGHPLRSGPVVTRPSPREPRPAFVRRLLDGTGESIRSGPVTGNGATRARCRGSAAARCTAARPSSSSSPVPLWTDAVPTDH